MISTFELSDSVVGILVDSDVNDKVMDEIHAEILSKLEVNKTINLFVEIEKGYNVSFTTILKDLILNWIMLNNLTRSLWLQISLGYLL